MTVDPRPSKVAEPFRERPWHGNYPALVKAGQNVVLPGGPELHRLALEVICSRGVPCYLTPYGSIRSVAAFAVGKTDDAFYNDGKVLLKAAVAQRESDGV